MAIDSLIYQKKIIRTVICFLCFSLVLLPGCSSNTTAPVNNIWNEVHTTQTHYTVQPGDTLYTIAWRFNLNDEALASWNHLSKPYVLQVGQILRLNGAASSETAAYDTTSSAPAEKIAESPHFVPVQSSKPDQATRQHAEPKAVTSDNATATATESKATDAKIAATETPGKGSWPWPAQGKLLGSYGQKGNKGIDIGLPVGSKIKAAQAGTVVYAGANLHGYGQLLIIKQKDDLITAYAHNSKLLVSEGAHVATGQVIALSGDSEASVPMLHFEVRKLGKTVDPLQYLAPQR